MIRWRVSFPFVACFTFSVWAGFVISFCIKGDLSCGFIWQDYNDGLGGSEIQFKFRVEASFMAGELRRVGARLLSFNPIFPNCFFFFIFSRSISVSLCSFEFETFFTVGDAFS